MLCNAVEGNAAFPFPNSCCAMAIWKWTVSSVGEAANDFSSESRDRPSSLMASAAFSGFYHHLANNGL